MIYCSLRGISPQSVGPPCEDKSTAAEFLDIEAQLVDLRQYFPAVPCPRVGKSSVFGKSSCCMVASCSAEYLQVAFVQDSFVARLLVNEQKTRFDLGDDIGLVQLVGFLALIEQYLHLFR